MKDDKEHAQNNHDFFYFCGLSYAKELQEKGVDFSKSEYRNHVKFKKLSNEFFESSIGLSISWLVERAVVSPELLREIYGSYAMGVSLSKDDNQAKIFNRASFLDYIYSLNEGRIQEIGDYFFRVNNSPNKPKGILYELRDRGLDIKAFNDETSVYKLLYLIYKVEHDSDLIEKYTKAISGKASKKSRINISKYFDNPTTENPDRSALGINTRNMDIIRLLKSETIKELDLEYAYTVQSSFTSIADDWNQPLITFYDPSHNNPGYQWSTEDIKTLRLLWDSYWNISLQNHKAYFGNYKENLLETFYLKLRQHEHISIENDLLLIGRAITEDYNCIVNQNICGYIKNSNLYDKYSEYHSTEARRSSHEAVMRRLRLWVLPYFKDKRIDKLTQQDLAGWKVALNAEKLALASKQNVYCAFVAMLNYAVRTELIPKNGLSALGNFKDNDALEKPTEPLRYYTAVQFEQFIAAAKSNCKTIKDWDFYVFFCIAFFTGARKGEINALRWSDIEGNILHIRRSITQKLGGGDVETAPKNKSSVRDLQLPVPLITVLNEHRQRQQETAQGLFSEDFRICGGEVPLRDTSIDKRNRKYAQAAGLARIKIHEYRHSHVSLLANVTVEEYPKNPQPISNNYK